MLNALSTTRAHHAPMRFGVSQTMGTPADIFEPLYDLVAKLRPQDILTEAFYTATSKDRGEPPNIQRQAIRQLVRHAFNNIRVGTAIVELLSTANIEQTTLQHNRNNPPLQYEHRSDSIYQSGHWQVADVNWGNTLARVAYNTSPKQVHIDFAKYFLAIDLDYDRSTRTWSMRISDTSGESPRLLYGSNALIEICATAKNKGVDVSHDYWQVDRDALTLATQVQNYFKGATQ